MYFFLQVTHTESNNLTLLLIALVSLATGLLIGWIYWNRWTEKYEKAMNDPRLDELQSRNSKLQNDLDNLQIHYKSAQKEIEDLKQQVSVGK